MILTFYVMIIHIVVADLSRYLKKVLLAIGQHVKFVDSVDEADTDDKDCAEAAD